MEEARRVDETIRNRLGPIMGYEPRDIRVHDSQQASDLAGRLGGGSVRLTGYTYGSPGTIIAGSKEGTMLTVREGMHMIRPTSARPMPLAAPLRRYQTLSSGDNTVSTQLSEGVTVQRAGARYRSGDSVQRQGKEATAQRAGESDMPRTESPSGSSSASHAGLEAMANMVYSMMMRDLELERERRP